MTKTETWHTPGEWNAEEFGNRMADGSRLWAVFAPDNSEYASTGELTMLAEGMSEGDAKLFAAAPNLLAACESVLCWLANCNHCDPSTLARQLMNAMQKAGMDKRRLDEASVALVRGPCSVPNLMGEEDETAANAAALAAQICERRAMSHERIDLRQEAQKCADQIRHQFSLTKGDDRDFHNEMPGMQNELR